LVGDVWVEGEFDYELSGCFGDDADVVVLGEVLCDFGVKLFTSVS